MALQSIGDLARHFSMTLQNRAIKTAFDQATKELGSGQKSDLPRALGGGAARLQALRHESGQMAGFQQATEEVAQILSAAQSTLQVFSDKQTDLASSLITAASAGAGRDIKTGAMLATAAFEDLVALLNTSFAGRSLFAGVAEDGPAIAPAGQMLDALRLEIAGAPDVAAVEAAIVDWFMAPGGGFEAGGFLGDTGSPATRRIGPDLTLTLEPRADDPAFRQALAAAALAALADDDSLPATDTERAGMLGHSAESLLAADFGVTRLRAALGTAEARAEDSQTELAARKTALDMMANDLSAADPFETAGKLQQLQLQLETHYTVTARMARLSLVGYLR